MSIACIIMFLFSLINLSLAGLNFKYRHTTVAIVNAAVAILCFFMFILYLP